MLVVPRGASYDQHGTVVWNFRLLQQIDRFRFIVVFCHQLFKSRITISILVVDLVLATARSKAYRSRIVLQHSDECARNAFFGQALGFFLPGPDLHHCGTVILDASFASYLRFFIGVDVFHVKLWRKISVLIEQIFPLLKACALSKVGDGRILLQSFNNLRCLLRQAIPFVRCGVIRLAVAIRQNVRRRNRSDYHQNVDSRVRRVPCLSGFEQLGIHL